MKKTTIKRIYFIYVSVFLLSTLCCCMSLKSHSYRVFNNNQTIFNPSLISTVPVHILDEIQLLFKFIDSIIRTGQEEKVTKKLLKSTILEYMKKYSIGYWIYLLYRVEELNIDYKEYLVSFCANVIATRMEFYIDEIHENNVTEALNLYATFSLSIESIKKIKYFFILKRHSIARYIQEHGQPNIEGGVLDLQNLGLRSLYGIDQIENPHRVFDLRLQKNNLETDDLVDLDIPESPFSLFYNIEALYLSYNNIFVLPKGFFSGLDFLTVLYLDNNNLDFLSEDTFVSNKKLTILYLDNNNISYLPPKTFSNIKHLRKLFLRMNKIQYLDPLTFQDLSNLRFLHLSNNKLQKLETDFFYGLHRLERLILGSNFIKSISPKAFFHLNKLELLYLGDNEIEELSPEVFTSLRIVSHLYLHNNKLKSVPEGIFFKSAMPNLKSLDVSGNNLSVSGTEFTTQCLGKRVDVALIFN